MGRQCFDFMVQSVYEIPENVMKQVMQNVLRKYRDFTLPACEPYIEETTGLEKTYSIPVMVNGPLAGYIGKRMPVLVQL